MDHQLRELTEQFEAAKLNIMQGKVLQQEPAEPAGSSSAGSLENVKGSPKRAEAGISPATSSPPKSFGASGSDPAASKPASPPAETPPKGKASGMYTGTVPEYPHDWEQHCAERRAEEEANPEAVQARARQEIIDASFAAVVSQMMRQKEEEGEEEEEEEEAEEEK